MLLLIDNYDSFTYNLSDYFLRLGEEVMLFKNDELLPEDLSHLNFDRVVISPGPNTPAESGHLMQLLPHLCGHYPILGVCLGHQALGQYFGAHLKLAIQPMHGKVSAINHNGKGIYRDLPQDLKVCRYHSLVIELPENGSLIQTASTKEGECMSFIHAQQAITGIQFHPEAILTESGMTLLNNWLKLSSL